MELSLTIKGTRPLIMQSDNGVDWDHPLVREKAKLNAKKTNKTDEDRRRVEELDFHLGIYCDSKIGPYIPDMNLLACLRDGGKKTRKGTKVLEALTIVDPFLPLIYEGPRDAAGLYAVSAPNGSKAEYPHRYRKSVVQGGSRVLKCRPRFDLWGLKAKLILNDRILGFEDLEEVCKTAGLQVGLGDYRPIFGRFEVIGLKKA